MIPLLIIPQILLSGVLVKYHDLYQPLSRKTVVPFLGDVMASRWAFEALAVNQFKFNEHEKKFYSLDKKIKHANYYGVAWFNTMNNLLEEWKTNPTEKAENAAILEKELQLATPNLSDSIKEQIAGLSFLNPQVSGAAIGRVLGEIRKYQLDNYKLLTAKRDNYMSQVMADKAKQQQYNERLRTYSNSSLNDFVSTLGPDGNDLLIEDKRIVKLSDPIYTDGTQTLNIRAHYLAPTKALFGKMIDTFWMNIIVLWGMSFVLLIGLKFDVVKKIVQ